MFEAPLNDFVSADTFGVVFPVFVGGFVPGFRVLKYRHITGVVTGFYTQESMLVHARQPWNCILQQLYGTVVL